MAARGTEHERTIARAKLAAMDARIPPPPPSTRNGAGWFDEPTPSDWRRWAYGTGTGNVFSGFSHTGTSDVTIQGPNGEKVTFRGVNIRFT